MFALIQYCVEWRICRRRCQENDISSWDSKRLLSPSRNSTNPIHVDVSTNSSITLHNQSICYSPIGHLSQRTGFLNGKALVGCNSCKCFLHGKKMPGLCSIGALIPQ